MLCVDVGSTSWLTLLLVFLFNARTPTTQTDVQVAKRVIRGVDDDATTGGSSRLLVTGAFAEERDVATTRDALFAEFNTLAVVYGRPSSQFVSPHYQLKAAAGGTGLAPFASPGGGGGMDPVAATSGANGNDLLDNSADDSLLPLHDGGEEEEDSGTGGGGGSSSTSPPGYAGPAGVDLLDMGGLGSSLPAAAEQQEAQAPAPGLDLVEDFCLSPESFQALWSKCEGVGAYNVQCTGVPAGGLPALEEALLQRRVSTLASGDLPEQWKLFLFTQDKGTGTVLLVEALLHKADMRLEVTVKTSAGGARLGGSGVGGEGEDPVVEGFMDHLSRALDASGMV